MPSSVQDDPVAPVCGCTHARIRRLDRVLSRLYDAELAGAGLKITQYALLSAIARDGPMPSHALAQMLSMGASTLSRNIGPLLAQALVEQLPDADRRRRNIRITELGLARLRAARAGWARAQRRLESALGETSVIELNRLIDDSLRTLEHSSGDSNE